MVPILLLERILVMYQCKDTLPSIGAGCFGSVYRGTDQQGQPIAIKVSKYGDAERLKKEYQLLCELQRQGNLSGVPFPLFFFLSEDEKEAHLAMNYIEGGLPIDQAMRDIESIHSFVHSIEQLFTIVAKLHTHDVIHNDLHEGNILMDRAGTVFVIDFGQAESCPQVSKTRDCRRLLALIRDLIDTQSSRFSPTLYAPLWTWYSTMSDWVKADATVTAHHFLATWRQAIPWMTNVQ
jgi:tRNA A-37 threonylcarbamoyl transferase component Bud32